MFKRLFSQIGRALSDKVTASNSPRRRPGARRNLAFESLETRQLLSITTLQNFSVSENTGEKPQSKVWEYDDQWYAVMPDNGATWLWHLDGTEWTQQLAIAQNDKFHADVKIVGNLAHVLLFDKEDSQLATLEYDHGPDNRYEMWSLQPQLVAVPLSGSTETAALEVDSTGRMWIVSDPGSNVEVRYSDGLYTDWSSSFIVGSGMKGDDIASVIAMPNGSIGVMWSNQNTDRFYFRTHVDGTAATQWSSAEVAASQSARSNMADDHINLAVSSNGTLYAAVKTSLGSPRMVLLVRRPDGEWDNWYPVDSGGTRPIVVINEAANKLLFAYTSSNGGGTIYYKESPLDNISLSPRQTLISGSTNNVTSVKAPFVDEVVVMSSSGSSVKSVMFRFDSPVVNAPPVVNAGPDQLIQFATGFTLAGSVTDDGQPTNGSLTANWSVVSAPGAVAFDNASSAQTYVTFSTAGTYVLQLTGNDGQLQSSDTVTVTVQPPPPVNQSPMVNAGPDRTIQLPNTATLTGTVTDDGLPGAPSTLTRQWSVDSGPGSVSFSNATAANTTATFGVAGTYVLRLTANDGQLGDFDTVTVTVLPPSEPAANQQPIVNTGPNQQIALGTSAVLDATVSDDGLPTSPGSVATTWSQIGGPGVVMFGDPNAIDTTATFSAPGDYVLQLTADDGEFTTSDALTVTVIQSTEPITAEFQDGFAMSPAYEGTTDTQISTASPGNNFGTSDVIIVDGQSDSAGLLQWDISSIPVGSTIVSAMIELNIIDSSTGNYELYALDRAWNELSATWDQAGANANWSTSGADGLGDYNPTPIGQLNPTNTTGIYQMALNDAGLAAVQSWINDPSSNFGLIIKDYAEADTVTTVTTTTTSGRGRRSTTTTQTQEVVDPVQIAFSSREATDATLRPKLILDYEPADGTTPPPINTAPVANSGADQTIQLPSSASLSGTVTDDGLPSASLSSTWSVVSGPGTVQFANANAAATTASFSTAGTYVLRLTANDGSLTHADDVQVQVLAAPPVNQQPMASAGADQTIQLPGSASLSGTVTDDGLPSASLSSTWSVVSGPGTVQFANANAAATTASFSTAGTYVLRLTANDGSLTHADDVQVQVLAAPPVNQQPMANAGADQTIQLPGSASLSGTVTDDGLPSASLSSTWSVVSGPGTVQFANANAAATTASFSTAGTYVLRLTANDGSLTHADDVQVQVLAAPPVNQQPMASAGADQTIQLPGSASLSGTVTDDGLPSASLSSTWSVVSGPGTVQFANANAAATTASFSTSGTYVLRLTANDGSLTHTDDVQIVVIPPMVLMNMPPIVNVGSDLSIELPNLATLTGTVSDDGLPASSTLSLQWTATGPGGVTFGDTTSASTTAEFSTAGTYTLRLTANDGEFVVFDELTVVVSDPPAPPTNTRGRGLRR